MNIKNNPIATNWSFENRYQNGPNERDYPLRVYNSGRDAAFEISLDMFEKNFELYCNKLSQGFRVVLNAPGDELSFDDAFELSLLAETVIAINPKLTTTSHKLGKYNPSHRKCFFDSERKLRFYKIYTQNNCYKECLANFTDIECGCVTFSQTSKIKVIIDVNNVNAIFSLINVKYRRRQEHTNLWSSKDAVL